MQGNRHTDDLHQDLFVKAFIAEAEKAYAEAVANGEFRAIEAEYQAASKYLLQHCNTDQKELLLRVEEEYQTMQNYAIQYAYGCGILSAFEQLFIGNDLTRYNFDALVVKGLYTVPQIERHSQYFQASNNIFELSQLLQKSMEKCSSAVYHIVSIECAWEQRIHSSALYAYDQGARFAASIVVTAFPEAALPQTGAGSYFDRSVITHAGGNTDFFRSLNNRIA